MSLSDTLRHPRKATIIVTVKTPTGRYSLNDVAACLKQLINSQGKPESASKGALGLTLPQCFDGYECIKAAPYVEPAPSARTKSKFGQISLPPIVKPSAAVIPGPGRFGVMWSKAWSYVKWVLAMLLGVVVEHLGLPALHWVFATLAHYVK